MVSMIKGMLICRPLEFSQRIIICILRLFNMILTMMIIISKNECGRISSTTDGISLVLMTVNAH